MNTNKIILFFLGLIFMTNFMNGQTDNILEKIINENSEKLSPVIQNLDKYEVQILFTEVERKEDNQIHLTTFSYNEKPKRYFYPASTVKFPAVITAFEKLNDLNIKGVNKYTHLSIDSLYKDHVSIPKEYKNECGYPNIADYAKRIFLVSDNESFNRLYDFLGQKEINERLTKRGFNNTKIIHRLEVARSAELNMQTNPINFYDETGRLLYHQPAGFDSTDVELDLTNMIKGVGYYSNGNLINEPKDFTENNFFGLRDQHNLMIRIMMPELFEEGKRFNLTDDDYEFLRKFMSMRPEDSDCPNYPVEEHGDFMSFSMFGEAINPFSEGTKIYNKGGLAYGYLTENAYIADQENDIEFFLTATVHVNENQIYNDDTYEYDEIGLPFLAKLGQIIYEYEKKIK